MRPLLKIILLCTLLISSIFANTEKINEYKSDLYYANGIMIGETKKQANSTWKNKIDDLFSNNQDMINKSINTKVSYNASENLFDDLYEAFLQSGNEQGWLTFSKYIPTYYGDKIPDSVNTHRPNLVTQINAYKESIKLGHGVIVIAHSQGNYYTNEAYKELDEWMKPYFHMMGVATPADHVAGGGTYVTFHNDIINLVLRGLASNRHNPNTQHDPILSYDAHDFYNSYMTAGNTKNEIQNFILGKINEHKNEPSQWEVENKLRENTEDYKVTLKHRFDTSITTMKDIEVYPFNLEKKLYHVKDVTVNDNAIKGNGWVMASFGGSEVLDSWDEQKDNESYKLDGTDPIEYIYDSNAILATRIEIYSTYSSVHGIHDVIRVYHDNTITFINSSSNILCLSHSITSSIPYYLSEGQSTSWYLDDPYDKEPKNNHSITEFISTSFVRLYYNFSTDSYDIPIDTSGILGQSHNYADIYYEVTFYMDDYDNGSPLKIYTEVYSGFKGTYKEISGFNLLLLNDILSENGFKKVN